MKPGVKTTEFLGPIVLIVAYTILRALDIEVSVGELIALATISSGYSISRGLAKIGGAAYEETSG